MSNKNYKFGLQQYLNRSKGFTLVEMLVGMALTSILAIIATQAITSVSKNFTQDQNTTANSQKMSLVLEIIGREIRQAGEFVTDDDFPVIQVKPRGTKGASIIIYRAISEPIYLCKQYTTGAAITELTFATDRLAAGAPNASNPACTVETADLRLPADTFPGKKIDGWITPRTNSTTLIGATPVLPGAVYDSKTKSIVPFIYSGEQKTDSPIVPIKGSLTLQVKTSSFTSARVIDPLLNNAIAIGNTAYLVQKREYLVCGTSLMVRTDSNIEAAAITNPATVPSNADPACQAANNATDPTASVDTVATSIDTLNITMVTRLTDLEASQDPANSKNAAFPIPPVPNASSERTWQHIQGVNIDIRSLDPLGSQTGSILARDVNSLSATEKAKAIASFSTQGTFYPRNVLSTR
jgi:prepilin-type N-terminal cleavage/methylation domain-containing protein